MLVSHVLVPPAMEAILASPTNRVQGFLAAGHVCAVMGFEEYEPIAAKYHVPIVVTGFEPLDILQGVLDVRAPAGGGPGRGGKPIHAAPCAADGNQRRAAARSREVFRVVPRKWRGIGEIPRQRPGPAASLRRL